MRLSTEAIQICFISSEESLLDQSYHKGLSIWNPLRLLELLLLLESSESLAAQVEEAAIKVLKLPKTKPSRQDTLHPSYLAAEVAAV